MALAQFSHPVAGHCHNGCTLLLIFLLAATFQPQTHAFVDDAFRKVQKDFLSLTRRVTAHHILLPSEEVASALKGKIRSECIDKERYVLDVFEEAARKYSREDATKARGGKIGTLVPMGYCWIPELDKLCFEVPLGQVSGPHQTDYGYHLLLVSERTNCPQLDGTNSRMMQTRGDDVFGTLVPGEQVGSVDLPEILVSQVGFWIGVGFAGGVVAELAQKLVDEMSKQ
jgi:hypothetical protein